MLRSLKTILILPILALFCATAGAQSPAPRPTSPKPFAGMDLALVKIEDALTKIDQSKKIAADFDLEAALESYQEELRDAYVGTLEAAQEDARKAERLPPGRQAGALAPAAAGIRDWEDKIAEHRQRAEEIVQRLTEINLEVRAGDVLLDPELVRTFSADEAAAFREWLTPEAIRRYRAIDRSLFAGLSPDPRLWQGSAPEQRLAGHADEFFPGTLAPPPPPAEEGPSPLATVLHFLRELIEPQAEAALAAGCVVACGTVQPEVCLACVAAALGTGAFLTTQLDNALDACDSRRTRLGRAICKAGVVLAYIVLIG
jgi:hypothetical protein